MQRRALWAAAILGIALLVAGAVLIGGALDTRERSLLASSGSAGFSLAQAVSFVGSTTVTVLLVVAGVALAWWRGRARDAFVAAFAILVAQVLDAILKLAFHRSRPPYALVVEDPWSFPSGHATRAAALLVALAWLAARRGSPARAATTAALLSIWTILMAWARLALGVHYASDVIGGIGIGLAGAALGILVADAWVDPVLAKLPAVISGRPR